MVEAAKVESHPDADEEAALWHAVREGSASARQQMFARHAKFANNIARRHYRTRTQDDIELADLCQLAAAGLLEAIDRFDAGRGAPFRAFAAHRINGSIADGLVHLSEVREQIAWRRRTRRDRMRSLIAPDQEKAPSAIEQLAELAMGLALGFMLEDTGLFRRADEEGDADASATTAYDSLAWKETLGHLEAELAGLAEREQAILRHHYVDGLDFERLAALFKISKGRVSQLHRAALLLLRKRLREHGHFRMIR